VSSASGSIPNAFNDPAQMMGAGGVPQIIQFFPHIQNI